MIKKIIFLFFVVLAIIYFRGINNHMKTNNSNSKIRIVSLSPSVTKKIIELDKTEYLVGRTFFCNYNEVKNVDVVSDLTHFNIDKIILLHPTHVISEYPIDEKSLYILKKNNINVISLNTPKSIKDIIANTEKSSLNSSVLHKKYYIIISCYEEEINTQNYSRDEIQSMIFSELYTRARSIMRTLSRCEVNSKILDSKGLVELLYNAYNREDSDIFSAQTAINAGFDSLYSTAPDVIDKKMKLINKQIEENGTKLANEAVMEAKSDKEMMLRIREENAKNLIFDFAEQLISENEEYLGKDISEDAKVKVRRKKKEATEGGNENETNEKTKATRGRRPSSGNE